MRYVDVSKRGQRNRSAVQWRLRVRCQTKREQDEKKSGGHAPSILSCALYLQPQSVFENQFRPHVQPLQIARDRERGLWNHSDQFAAGNGDSPLNGFLGHCREDRMQRSLPKIRQIDRNLNLAASRAVPARALLQAGNPPFQIRGFPATAIARAMARSSDSRTMFHAIRNSRAPTTQQ